MTIEYNGNVYTAVYTAEEILRMREKESWEDQLRLTINQLISSAGLENVVWIMRRIATRESEMRLLQEEPTIERDKLISKYAALAEKLEEAEDIMVDIQTRAYD